MSLKGNPPPHSKKDMLLFLVLALVDLVSSYGTETVCYGSSYEVPMYYTPPLFTTMIYYKPRGEERILVVNNKGESMHKRFVVTYGNIRMTDLTEQDDEAVVFYGNRHSVQLTVQDCQSSTTKFYGELFSWKVASGAEYLEFSHKPSSGFALKPQVIWSRTNSSSGRGKVKRNYFELNSLKQKDSGYYRFRGANDDLRGWKRLIVEERHQTFERLEGDSLEIYFPVSFYPGSLYIEFSPAGRPSDIQLITKKEKHDRRGFTNDYMGFIDLKHEDSGTYRFMDDEGFTALLVELEVRYATLPAWVYIVALIIVVLVIIFCCCCVKKCCCKKRSNKQNSPQSEAAAPPVFYHDTTQPTQPVIPLLSREPRIFTADPPPYDSAAGRVELPPSTQVTVPGGLGDTATSAISSSSGHDPDPIFEFKGRIFPSAPPLSSGTTIQDVYTSDKLNFL